MEMRAWPRCGVHGYGDWHRVRQPSMSSHRRACPGKPCCGLPARPWKDLINDGLLRRRERELFQEFREATSPGGPPALQLRQHARKREGRQVEAERLQDTGQNRLAAGAVDLLAGATRQPRLRRST